MPYRSQDELERAQRLVPQAIYHSASFRLRDKTAKYDAVLVHLEDNAESAKLLDELSGLPVIAVVHDASSSTTEYMSLQLEIDHFLLQGTLSGRSYAELEALADFRERGWPISAFAASARGKSGQELGQDLQLLISDNAKALKRFPCEQVLHFPFPWEQVACESDSVGIITAEARVDELFAAAEATSIVQDERVEWLLPAGSEAKVTTFLQEEFPSLIEPVELVTDEQMFCPARVLTLIGNEGRGAPLKSIDLAHSGARSIVVGGLFPLQLVEAALWLDEPLSQATARVGARLLFEDIALSAEPSFSVSAFDGRSFVDEIARRVESFGRSMSDFRTRCKLQEQALIEKSGAPELVEAAAVSFGWR